MVLSMWILLDELKDYETEAEISKGDMCIEMIQLAPVEMPEQPEDRYVYILGEDNDILLLNGPDRIAIRNAGVAPVINRLLQVFDDYRDWSGRLTAATEHDAPLQDVLDIAHEKFHCPMFFGNIDRHIMAITRQYTDEEVYDGWEEVLKKGTFPYSMIKYLSEIGFRVEDNEKPQAIEPVWEGMHFAHQIRTNCYFRNAVWGHLYLYWKEEDVAPAVLQKAAFVAGIYEKMIAEHEVDMKPQYYLHSWLVDAIHGEKPQVDPIISIYQHYHWKHADPLVLFKIERGEEDYSDDFLLYWMCDTLARLTGQAVFPMDTSAIVVALAESVDRTTENISRVLHYNHFSCGISLPFVGTSCLRMAYTQAEAAIRMAPDTGNKIHRYRDCLLEGMISHYRTAAGREWKQMIIPALWELFEENEKGRYRDLYSTLKEYLHNDNSISETAAAMQIHRNTLVYRLKKIESALEMDLDQEKNHAYLQNCILLLDGMKDSCSP